MCNTYMYEAICILICYCVLNIDIKFLAQKSQWKPSHAHASHKRKYNITTYIRIYIYAYVCVYIYIYMYVCSANPMSRRRPKRLKAEGFCWFFNFHPFISFQKLVPQKHMQETFSSSHWSHWSFEGVTRWHSDKASGAFPNGIQNLLETWLSMQRGCSKDLNINVRKSTEYH